MDALTADPRAWDAHTVPDPAAWYHAVPEGLVSALLPRIAGLTESAPLTDLRLSDDEIRAWSPVFEPARRALEQGCGFAILDRLPMDQLTPREATALYWLIGQLFGEPFAQNVEGTLLYDVRDTGQNVASGARFSVTNYESSFHTDNSFGDSVLNYVALLCLQPAQAGGLSQHVSGFAVHNLLQREHPDVWESLTGDFHVDRRGGVREGESPTALRPILAWDDSELLIRYLRFWIEAGHAKVLTPLTQDQRRALDVFDRVLGHPELRVEFALEPGQMYFLNNRWMLHNRTAFTDDPQRRRHLVRLWLRAPDGRDHVV